jgi:hypothetical protein
MGYNQDNSAQPPVLQVSNSARNIYCVVIDFAGAQIYPGGQSHFSKEVQFRLGLPPEAKAGSWDPSNDPSFAGLQAGSDPMVTGRIPIYENEILAAGTVPEGSPVIRPAAAGERGLIWSSSRGELSFVWPAGQGYRVVLRAPSGRLLVQSAGRGGAERVRLVLRGLPPGMALVSIYGSGKDGGAEEGKDGPAIQRKAIAVLP